MILEGDKTKGGRRDAAGMTQIGVGGGCGEETKAVPQASQKAKFGSIRFAPHCMQKPMLVEDLTLGELLISFTGSDLTGYGVPGLLSGEGIAPGGTDAGAKTVADPGGMDEGEGKLLLIALLPNEGEPESFGMVTQTEAAAAEEEAVPEALLSEPGGATGTGDSGTEIIELEEAEEESAEAEELAADDTEDTVDEETDAEAAAASLSFS